MRAIFLVFFVVNLAFSCALCALYSPTAHAKFELISQDGNLKFIKMHWEFSENFSQETKFNYDKNSDNILDERELNEVKKALLEYLVPRKFLLNLTFYKGEKGQRLEYEARDTKVVLDEKLKFEFLFSTDLSFDGLKIIVAELNDPEGFFDFSIAQDDFLLDDKFGIKANANLGVVYMEVVAANQIKDRPKLSQIVPNLDKKDELENLDFFSSLAMKFVDNLKQLLRANNGNFSILNFALTGFISFIYGFLHAAGPGHSKMLVGSYFLANNQSYKKALKMAFQIGFFHTFFAMILVIFAIFIAQVFVSTFTNNIANFTTQFASILVILLAFFMLYTKFKSLKTSFKFKKASNSFKIFPKNSPNFAHSGCSCQICAKNRQISSSLVVIASSVVPCPGVVLVFSLAFSLGSYATAIFSGFMMGFGMSFVVFLAAIFGNSLSKSFGKFGNFRKFVEIFAIFVVLGVGIFMFLVANRINL